MTANTPLPRILIVDDDHPTRQLLLALMRRLGRDVVEAQNGTDAIECLRLDSFAVIILDLMMPAVDGQGVLDFLQAAGRQDPVIICTAAGLQRTEKLDKARVRAVVRKPFDIDVMTATVRELMAELG
jgi:CheY-like chemotaxis protein